MKGTSIEVAGYIPESMRWETKFDKFMKQLHKQGLTYAEWQNQKYATKSTYKGGEKQL